MGCIFLPSSLVMIFLSFNCCLVPCSRFVFLSEENWILHWIKKDSAACIFSKLVQELSTLVYPSKLQGTEKSVICTEKLWMPHHWKCSNYVWTGLWSNLTRWNTPLLIHPSLWQEGWNWLIFKGVFQPKPFHDLVWICITNEKALTWADNALYTNFTFIFG